MWKSALEIAKTKQPISTTGMFSHTYYWLTSASGNQTFQNPSHKNNQDNATAIYFIHGTADQPGAFQRIAERLIQAGLPNEISCLTLLAFDQRYHGYSIEDFSGQLMDKILTNNHKRVILFAHSRGGLIAAYFAEFLAHLAHIEVLLIITVGTPFNGSYLALKPLSWFSDSIRQMEVNSEFLFQLKKKIMENTRVKYHFAIAKEDSIVPGEAGFIKEYVDKYPDSLKKYDRHGHLSVMSSHRLVTDIAILLKINFCSPPNLTEEKTNKMFKFSLIDNYSQATL